MKKVKQLGLAAVGMLATMASSTAAASDWGCQVLLCMSNPGGPMQYAACVPPMKKLYRHLEKGGSFPSCKEAGNTKMQHLRTKYMYCPEGMATLKDGIKATTREQYEKVYGLRRNILEGTGEDGSICVAGPAGRFKVQDPNNQLMFHFVNVYDRILVQKPQAGATGRASDIYVEGVRSTRAFW